MSVNNLVQNIWKDYTKRTSHAEKIYDVFKLEGETIVNDHFGFRTFNLSPISIEHLAQFFIRCGYKENGTYNFPAKKIFAKHYEHEDPILPKVFISELVTEQFSSRLQTIIKSCIEQIPQELFQTEDLLCSGASWYPLSHKIYQELLNESEYAAWVYVFGFCANHFTMNVNECQKFTTIEEVNNFLITHDIKLNASGGLIKGSAKEHLIQSSTLAEMREIDFVEGRYHIPSCYFGFSKRYPLPNGKLYTGFVATSTDKMFESTDSWNRG